MNNFKDNLKKIRMAKTLSQKDLSKITGLDPSYISRCETGGKKPGMDILIKFSKALNCTIDELVIDNKQ